MFPKRTGILSQPRHSFEGLEQSTGQTDCGILDRKTNVVALIRNKVWPASGGYTNHLVSGVEQLSTSDGYSDVCFDIYLEALGR
jgi:hypothetical protein